MLQSQNETRAEESQIAEAIRRAVAAGYLPARGQRAVDWAMVALWAREVQKPGFCWRGMSDMSVDAIVVSAGPEGSTAIHAGQHRILGGLLGGNPVPESSITRLRIADHARGWNEPTPELSLNEILWG